MNYFSRKLTELGEFFARDILSFSILICLFTFLVNILASAQPIIRSSASGGTIKNMKPKKFVEDRPSGSLSKQIKFHNETTPKNWQLSLELTAAQKAVNNGSQQDQNSNAYLFHTESSFKFANDMSLKGLIEYQTHSKNELQSDISDLLLSFYFLKTKIGSGVNLTPYLVSTVPLSKDSTQRQQMSFGFGGGASLSTQTGLASGTLTTAGGVSVQKYFHKFETALNNSVNTSYSSNQQISTGWEYKQISASLLFRHVNSWNYAGTMKEVFLHLQALSWNATSQLSFSFGHTNSGNVLSPNQEDIEIRIIDDNASTLFVSTAYVF
jgi:hypothetical protein